MYANRLTVSIRTSLKYESGLATVVGNVYVLVTVFVVKSTDINFVPLGDAGSIGD